MYQNSKKITAAADYSGAMKTRDHSKNGASPKSLMSRGKKCIALLTTVMLFASCNYFSNTEYVKNAILYDVDYSISIGDALDKYKYFTKTEWEEFTTANGREIVEFKGYYFKNNVIVRIQFILNKDLQEDSEGINFRVGYQCYSYVTNNGEKREVKHSYLINNIYKNKEISNLSSKNLREW
jgi:hypothetical protein